MCFIYPPGNMYLGAKAAEQVGEMDEEGRHGGGGSWSQSRTGCPRQDDELMRWPDLTLASDGRPSAIIVLPSLYWSTLLTYFGLGYGAHG